MSLVRREELTSTAVPERAIEAIAADADLPVCETCGTQYAETPKGICPCCEDERQWSPASGQTWTTLGNLSASHTHSLMVDTEDSRIAYIQCEPPFAINQTPILINTHAGHYIWDCQAPFTPGLAGYLSSLKPVLKAIVISHPHFFSTSLTWSRALDVPLYICATDKEWYQRGGDIKPDDNVRFWTGRESIGPGVTVVQCGGHFPGSSVLHWDRSAEPGDGAKTGVLLTADTMMVRMDRKGFTWMWSYPNMIPLTPSDAVNVVKAVDDFEFGVASSTWPNRMIRGDAKKVMHKSIERYLDATGWKSEGGTLKPK